MPALVRMQQLKETETKNVEDFRVQARNIAIRGSCQEPIELIAPAQRPDDDRGCQRAVTVVVQALARFSEQIPRSRDRVAAARSAS